MIQCDGEAIGVVDLIKDFPEPCTSFLGLFLLRETSQRKGLGKEAYAAVEAYAIQDLVAKKIRLAVVDANPVLPFWEKMGFKETGELRPHEGQNINSTKRLMEKTLPPRPKDFDSLLYEQINYFMELKRLYRLQMGLFEACEDRLIKNDLIYQQMLFASIDGLFVRLDNFCERLQKVLNIFKCDHLDQFKRNKKRGLTVDPKQVVSGGQDEQWAARAVSREFERASMRWFDETYDRLLPGVKERDEGRPNHADFNRVAQNLRDMFAPIKAHRDTVVAHWDEKQSPATVVELKKARREEVMSIIIDFQIQPMDTSETRNVLRRIPPR